MESIAKMFLRKEPSRRAKSGLFFTEKEQKILAENNVILFTRKFPADAEDYMNREFRRVREDEE